MNRKYFINSNYNDYAFVVIVHRLFINGIRKLGGLDKIINFLSNKGKILLIEHPLFGLNENPLDVGRSDTIISEFYKGKTKELNRTRIPISNKPLRWSCEVIFNVFFLRNIKNKPIFISSDPLNGLSGVVLGFKFSKKYYHCVDYSNRRFNNRLLRFIYTRLLRINLRLYDLISVVSLKTREEIIKIGTKAEKILYIPNSPPFKKIDATKKEQFSLICTGGAIVEKYNYPFALDIIEKLKKNNPKVKLYAIGDQNWNREYFFKIKRLIKEKKLSDNVLFTGFLDSNTLENYLLKSQIGISFYSPQVQYYTVFGDSLKIREYALYGIPTISDGNSATDEEMKRKGAGIIVKTVEQAVEAISNYFNNHSDYEIAQENCIAWANKMDKNKILQNLYKLLNK